MRSPLLDDATFPSVLSARKIVSTHARIVMRREGWVPAESPARRRMTVADTPNMTAAATLARRNGGVRTDWVPPQASVTGKTPSA